MYKFLFCLTTDHGEAENQIKKQFEGKNIEADVQSVSSLVGIKNALNDKAYDAIVTQYKIGARPFTIDELTDLKETNDAMRIIIVLPTYLKGDVFMRSLLNEDICEAVFEEDASYENIAELAVNGRARKAARSYYGILEEKLKQNRGDVVDPDLISELKQYLLYSKDETFEARLRGIDRNFSTKEISALFALLDQETIDVIKKLGGFEKYFSEEPRAAADASSGNVKDGITNTLNSLADFLSSRAGAKTVTVKRELRSKKVVGVIGLYRGAGATTTAVSLAKTISEYENVCYIEVPENGAVVYDRYRLDLALGASFRSVPHMVYEGCVDFSDVDNVYEGVRFFVGNSSYPDVRLDVNQLATLINGTSDNVVIDLACGLDESRRRGFLNLLTHIIIVCEASHEEEYLGKLKDEINSVQNGRIEPYVLRIESEGDVKTRFAGAMFSTAKRNYTTGKVGPLSVSGGEKRQLLEYLNIEGDKSRGKKRKPLVIQRGVVDIAVAGLSRNVGTTHTALMLADSLRQQFRVAYVELNQTGQIEHLAAELEYEDSEIMHLRGIDVYHGIDYRTFAEKYRNKYSYVILDFGHLSSVTKRRELFAMCASRFIVADAAPWKLYMIDEQSAVLDEFDSDRRATILLPMASKDTVKEYDLYQRFNKREIVRIPFSEMPVECEPEIAAFIKKIIIS